MACAHRVLAGASSRRGGLLTADAALLRTARRGVRMCALGRPAPAAAGGTSSSGGTRAGARFVKSQVSHGGYGQGLTLVHFSAQLEPCLSQENTLHTLNTLSHPLKTSYTTPTRTPYPI